MTEMIRSNSPLPAEVEQVTQAAPGRSNRTAHGPRGHVTIFGQWCKGCRLCVEFCPTGVLAFVEDQEQPSVVQPEKCTACHWCDTHCPDLAIVVTKI